MRQGFLYKITALYLLCTVNTEHRFVWLTLSLAADKGEDDDFGVSDDSDDVKKGGFANYHCLILYQSKNLVLQ